MKLVVVVDVVVVVVVERRGFDVWSEGRTC